MSKHKPNTIWIDADACPRAVKELIFKVSSRLNINIILVANSYQIIPQKFPSFSKVDMMISSRKFKNCTKSS